MTRTRDLEPKPIWADVQELEMGCHDKEAFSLSVYSYSGNLAKDP